MALFLACLEKSGNAHGSCRAESREYLKCRMEGDLMAPEDLDTLGFGKDIAVVPSLQPAAPQEQEIIAGLAAAKKGGGTLFGFGSGGPAKRGGGH